MIDEIRSHHRTRCFAMEQRKRADLSLGSFLRLMLGWSRDLPDADRKRISAQAQALIKLGEQETKGKLGDIDEPAYHEWRHVILPSIAARSPFNAVEADALKHMTKLAKELPAHEWVETVRGFGAPGLAIIVGEAGDLGDYPKKGHLWKRMGLAVIDGVRQGGLSKSTEADAWIAHGYNRQRRSRMWNIGDALIKGNGDGAYRACYLARKEYERARAEAAGLTVLPAADIKYLVEKKKADPAAYMSDGHVHRRAQRYMEKRLLRDLLKEWKRAKRLAPTEANKPLPASMLIDEGDRAA